MKHQAAIARARAKFASGGALPKADKGDFKQADVLRQMVRAVQDYWLSDTYADPRGVNVTRQAMTDPPAAPTRALKAPRADTLPAIWQGVPGFADGGVISEEESFRQMPPVDQWNAPREAPPADPAATRARNLRDLLSIIPGPGNVIAAEDAGTAFKDASAAAGEGRYGAAAGNTALGLLSGVGAVTGLPVGRLAAGATKGASSRTNVFVPAGDTPDALRAKAWRAAGVPNEHVHKGTGLSFDPGGNLRREISDFPMKVDLSKAKPGTIFPLGDVVDHPELFKAMPHLRNQPVQVGTKVNEFGHGASRTHPETGVFELSTAPGGDIKGDLAKMLQYRISDEAGFPSSLRHQGIARDLEAAQKAAVASGSPHAAEYANLLEQAKQQYFEDAVRKGQTWAGQVIQSKVAGNLESRHVRARAADEKNTEIYPWYRNVPYMLTKAKNMPARFGDVLPLPPEDRSPKAMSEFLDKWKSFGAGKGGDPEKFATGGSVKSMVARARQKLAAGGMVGPTGGRTDAVPVAAGEGSYVIPADVVAALGEGNSVAGHKMLESRFKSTGSGKGPGVDIIVSDGEFIITPEQVAALGGGDIAYGHQVLDAFVLNTRKRNIEELSQLPGPKQ